ncbi:MAG: serine/threonine protein kinase [Deltaproteobacteria bacterium]|nr:serine/threonine protein kinase [Deltaproteobacteria bacterium]
MISGELFGPYRLLRPLGRGGMAEVFLAEAHVGGSVAAPRLLAIKRLLPPFNVDKQLVSMMLDEARVCVRLMHPNIVQVYDFGRVEGSYYIAMEYVDGIDLCRLIRRNGGKAGRALPLPTAIYVTWQLANALHYAHTRRSRDGEPLSIIHRDVSPHNVMVSRNGEVKLADFGLARASISVHKSQAGVIRGKFAYMPKEQAHGREIDQRVDLFACGAVLYEALTGLRPYSAANLAQQLYQLEQPVPLPSHHMPDIPPEIDELTMQALSPNPEDRYRSAADLAQDLGHALKQMSNPRQEAQHLAALIADAVTPRTPMPRSTVSVSRHDFVGNEFSLIGDALAQVHQEVTASAPMIQDISLQDTMAAPSSVAIHDTLETSVPSVVAQQAAHQPSAADAREITPRVTQPSGAVVTAIEPVLPPPRRSERREPQRFPVNHATDTIANTIDVPEDPLDGAETTVRSASEAKVAIDRELEQRQTTTERPASRMATEVASPPLVSGRRTAVAARRKEPSADGRRVVLIAAAAVLLAAGMSVGWFAHRLWRDSDAVPRTKLPRRPIAQPDRSRAVRVLDQATIAVDAGLARRRTTDATAPKATDARASAAKPRSQQRSQARRALRSQRRRRAAAAGQPSPAREQPAPKPPAPQKKPTATQDKGDANGTLSVVSEKPGVLLIGNRPVARTPASLSLEPGLYQIRVMFVESRKISSVRWVQVEAGKKLRASFKQDD